MEKNLEVESKIILDFSEDEKRLICGAVFLGEEDQTNTYLDKIPEYPLITSDRWLRLRKTEKNGAEIDLFELKIGQGENEAGETVYDEVSEDEKIAKELDIPLNIGSPLTLYSLKRCGFEIVVLFQTKRRSYKKENLTICVDCSFSLPRKEDGRRFDYSVVEVEKMVKTEDEKIEALREIDDFLKKSKISYRKARGGKATEWIRFHNPALFGKLFPNRLLKDC